MTTSATPSDPKLAADATPVAPTFGDWLHQVWKNQGTLIITVCVVMLLAVFAKGGWEYYEAQREVGIEGDYAAADTPEKLKAFATANTGHLLAGVAQLRLADDAYTAGKYADALAGYESAAATLKTGPVAARAQLGAAMTRLASGKTAEGEAALKQFATDPNQLKGIRAEAAYNLASLAAEAGRAEDVVKYSDQLMVIDPSSPWTQRALGLRATLPVTPTAVMAPKPDQTTPSIQLKLPGK
jgi:hypothetical protein